jgi:hypothetical protein
MSLCCLDRTSDTWFSMPGTWCISASSFDNSNENCKRIPSLDLHNRR